ncbi:glycoside hydrolase family 2 protein [Paenibacillus sp. 2TAB19]|uniref:glycoside hydrolase family 2 protein n=1 Tax=Paenibacillus sp. 2TAB19 TaxID=3233003 RepID=UPI003F9B5C74
MSYRESVPLTDNWRFRVDPDGIGLRNHWYADKLDSAREVKIPHTWNVEDGLEEYRGTAWYSYHLAVPTELEGKLLRLQFDAIYRDATVWLNGIRVGEHKHSGYTTFIIDITEAAKPGNHNVLTVSVNNENSDQALPMSNSFDWADDGGIILGVSLIITGAAAIDYAKIIAKPEFEGASVTASRGTISGQIKLWDNGLPSDLLPTVHVNVLYQDKLIASEAYPVRIENGCFAINEITIDQIKLWHFDHPHLYTLKLMLEADGTNTDELSIPVGFREIKNEGSRLLLNREPVRLMGVEWMPGSNPHIGMAETVEDFIRSLEQIKNANCVITRFHWQQDSKLLDWCDLNGLLVQEEIPHWQQPDEPDDALLPVALQHAAEMITRHFNHPCIYAWGIGNEVNGQSAQTVAYMNNLRTHIERMDNTRFINYVSNSIHTVLSKDATGIGDLLMWNDYIGTWHGELDESEVIDRINAAYPDKPLTVAEYGLCEPAFEGGDPRRIQILMQKTEEYRKHDQIAALIFFSLNDYRTQMGEEGVGRLRQRVHGTTDVYGKPKPSYQALREIGAPITVKVERAQETEAIRLTLSVRNDIPSYSVSGYILKVMMAGAEWQSLFIPSLSPGEQWTIEWYEQSAEQADNIRYEIFRPTGFKVIEGTLSEALEL